MTNINFSNVSPELIKLAQNSLKGDKSITQKEYDDLVKIALKDKSLNRDEQLFLASLDNNNLINKLLDSKFNPKSFEFNVSNTDSKNPTLKIVRDNKNILIDVRAIDKNQTLESNLSKGKAVCEYVSTHLLSANKFKNIPESFLSILGIPRNVIARGVNSFTSVNEILDSPTKNIKNPGFDYSEVHKIARIAHQHNVGNCGENAALSAIMLANYGVSPVETFSIPGHSFAVIGRDPSSEITDPKTWGNTAVIVDSF